MVPDPGLRLGGEEVVRRAVKELHHGRVLPGRRVGDVHDDLSAGYRFSQAFTGYGVDAGLGRCRHHLMAALRKILANPRSDESATADDYDFHGRPSFANGGSTTVSGLKSALCRHDRPARRERLVPLRPLDQSLDLIWQFLRIGDPRLRGRMWPLSREHA